MTDNLTKALDLLKNGGYTCVVSNGKEILTFEERGVRPLISLYNSGKNFSCFCAADKVIGKGAAMLYVLLGIKEVYAGVISQCAADVFLKHGITFYCDIATQRIINRAGTGLCPIEEAVIDINDPNEALNAIIKKLENL